MFIAILIVAKIRRSYHKVITPIKQKANSLVISIKQKFLIAFTSCFLFIQKRIYNGHKNEKSKTKIHITVIRCKVTITIYNT